MQYRLEKSGISLLSPCTQIYLLNRAAILCSSLKLLLTKGGWGFFFFGGDGGGDVNLSSSIKGHEITPAEDVPCTATTDHELSLGME